MDSAIRMGNSTCQHDQPVTIVGAPKTDDEICNMIAAGNILQIESRSGGMLCQHCRYGSGWIALYGHHMATKSDCAAVGSTSFKRFLETCDLIEFPLVGQRFTWFHGESTSRIDRAFASPICHLIVGLLLQCIPAGLSDHCHLLLECQEQDTGWKPFRFLDCWLYHSWFMATLTFLWEASYPQFPGQYKLLKKFKLSSSMEPVSNAILRRGIHINGLMKNPMLSHSSAETMIVLSEDLEEL
ncbi:hypothetical protein SADUNF_Sadunf02G0159900 [Salix dunnii]|uniref:Uncharacterized protein n=1 Tax=Salix dunnii TaxID=1413687 RepID=A0A835TIE0_9ROSI|nr:hypothetical protein SADUNF_Sadunf02G0159900 [Salix dunnii]